MSKFDEEVKKILEETHQAPDLKAINNMKAVKFIDQKIAETRRGGSKQVILGHDEKPFYHDETTGDLMALVTVVGHDPQSSFQPRTHGKINLTNPAVKAQKIAYTINSAIEEFVGG